MSGGEKKAQPVTRLNLTDRAILGVLYESYPKYVRQVSLNEKLTEYPDSERELAHLIRKRLVEKIGVAPQSLGRRVLDNQGGALDNLNLYSDKGYRITGEGIDAFKKPFKEPFIELGTRGGKPKALPVTPVKCSHKKMSLVEVKPKAMTRVKGNRHAVGAKKTSSEFVGIFFCPECKSVFWKDAEHIPK